MCFLSYVVAKPSFLQVPEDVAASVGETIKLACNAVGNPRPDILWTKDDIPVQQSDKFQVCILIHIILENLNFKAKRGRCV